MKTLFEPLTEAEIDRLEEFLASRNDDMDGDAVADDEGILDMSELDGLFTAIVSSPVVIPPSQWLPAIWGEFEPEWESDEAFEEIFSLMVRHMNGIAEALLERADEFEPLYFEHEIKGELYTVVDEWCYGYLRGVDLQAELWAAAPEVMEKLLMPIIAFATDEGEARLDKSTMREVEELQQAIAPSVRAIHAYWLAQRINDDYPGASMQTFRHDAPRAGRNDLCPCGSGKKYKKCCLH